MDKLRIGLRQPVLWRLVDLTGKHRDGDRDLDGREFCARHDVFPIDATAGRAGVRQPIQCDVVEDGILAKGLFGIAACIHPVGYLVVKPQRGRPENPQRRSRPSPAACS